METFQLYLWRETSGALPCNFSAINEIRTYSDDFEIRKINNGKKVTTLKVPHIIDV
jgi:hypothetical protein